MTELEFDAACGQLTGMLEYTAAAGADGLWMDRCRMGPTYYILVALLAVMREVFWPSPPYEVIAKPAQFDLDIRTFWDLRPADAAKFLSTLGRREREALKRIADRLHRKELH
jgi:hypothetical protein